MNYSSIQLKTVVDFLEFEIRTTARTQAWRIEKAMNGAVPFVVGHDAETGTAFAEDEANTPTTLFRFHIQDPKSFKAVKTLLAQLGGNLELQSPPKLTAIEIAFDSYCTGASKRQLAEIATDRYRFSTCIPSRDWHFYKEKGEKPRYLDGRNCDDEEMNRREIIQHFENGCQLADTSDKSANVRRHLYVKSWNSGSDIADPNKWCARDEITLRGDALPCTMLEELEHIDFASFAKHFKYKRLADNLHPAARHVLTQCSGKQLGRRGEYLRKHKSIVGKYRNTGPSKFRASVTADPMSEVVSEKLRTLTGTWRSKSVCADFPGNLEALTHINTGNSDALLMICLNNTIHRTDSTNDSINKGSEAQRADSTDTDKHTNEPDALRLSRLTDNDNDATSETMTPEMLRISRLMEIDADDAAQRADVTTLDASMNPVSAFELPSPHRIEVLEESSGGEGRPSFNWHQF